MFVMIKYTLPVFPSISCLKNTSFRVSIVAKSVAQNSYPCNIFISWMYYNFAYKMGIAEPDMFPCLSAIYCTVHSVTGRHIPPDASLTHSRINDVCVGWSNGDSANRACFEIPVRYINPVYSAISSFINTPSGKAGVVGVRLICMSRNGYRAATTEWADITVL